MLSIPKGTNRSINTHNVDFEIIYDWIEASALFLNEEISGSDVVDYLIEAGIYDEQNFAWELVSSAFSQFRLRAKVLGDGYPFTVEAGDRLVAKGATDEFAAYGFCLVLSLPAAFPEWARSFGPDYTEQGELFESLTAEAVRKLFKDWVVHPTGWTRANAVKLKGLVIEIAELLGETVGDVDRWGDPDANEAGLDLLCYMPFEDRRVGLPVYMLQCASGADWKKKLKTPDLEQWSKVVDFAARPKKAFAMPFVIPEADFVRAVNRVEGPFLDRYRLLAPGANSRDWLPEPLAGQLAQWVNNRVATLPSALVA